MTNPSGQRAMLALAAALVVAAPFFPRGADSGAGSIAGCSKKASADAKKTYTVKGTIKSFGPDKKYVNIAHEDIPGYMAAMTMSFEPEKPSLLDGLSAGDRVTFTFADENGKRVLTDIKKAP